MKRSILITLLLVTLAGCGTTPSTVQIKTASGSFEEPPSFTTTSTEPVVTSTTTTEPEPLTTPTTWRPRPNTTTSTSSTTTTSPRPPVTTATTSTSAFEDQTALAYCDKHPEWARSPLTGRCYGPWTVYLGGASWTCCNSFVERICPSTGPPPTQQCGLDEGSWHSKEEWLNQRNRDVHMPVNPTWVEVARASSDDPPSCSNHFQQGEQVTECNFIVKFTLTRGMLQRIHWISGPKAPAMELRTQGSTDMFVTSWTLSPGISGDWWTWVPAGTYQILVHTGSSTMSGWSLAVTEAR